MELIASSQSSIDGFERYDLPSGDRYLKLHHYADSEKGEAWLERVRREMSGTPAQFKQQILMQDHQAEGALWSNEWFEVAGFRLPRAVGSAGGRLGFRAPVECERIVVALDPSASDPERQTRRDKEPDACGLVVAGVTAEARFVVLGDFSGVMKPGDWARLAVQLYSMCNANVIIAEANNGGEMVREVIHGVAHNVPVELVHAGTSKRARAEPVALIYEHGQASHCGPLDALEGEMVNWDATDGSPSPNRIDATTWAAHGLGLCRVTGQRVVSRLRVNR